MPNNIKKTLLLLNILLIISNIISCKEKSDVLKIASANLNYANKNADKISDIILSLSPDIIVLVEYTGSNINIKKLLNQYKIVVEDKTGLASGIAVFAKKAINIQGEIIPSPIKGSCCWKIASVSLSLNNKQITIFGIHTPPPVGRCKEYNGLYIAKLHEWINRGKLKKNIGAGYKDDLVILAGDFNAFSFNKYMKKFKKLGLVDSHTKRKTLYEPTWSPFDSDLKLLRIDYIFISKYLNCLKSKTFIIPGSDHKGVIAEIEF